jgi:hypothetical protein
VKTPVVTSQVAVTILEALGIGASELDAVRKEHTAVLPYIFTDEIRDDKNWVHVAVRRHEGRPSRPPFVISALNPTSRT